MRSLTVLYDAQCEVCRRARAWLERQAQYVPLEFVAAGSDEARARFPGLDARRTLEEVTAVGDDGAVYRSAKAWVVCLWALVDYRRLSLKLARPRLLPRAERFVARRARRRRRR